MSDSLARNTAGRKYRRQDAALSTYVRRGGSRTLAGAHAKELRLKAELRRLMGCYPVARALRLLGDARSYIATLTRPVSPQLVTDADRADLAEESAQTAYLLDPNPVTRETYIRAIYTEAAAQDELARSLTAEAKAR